MNVTPKEEAGNLTLIMKYPGNNYSLKTLTRGKWISIKILSPGNYTTYILNTGDKPANITVYYDLGVQQESKPYVTDGLLLIATGLAFMVGSIAYYFTKKI